MAADLLRSRLTAEGYDVAAVAPAAGGLVAFAGLVTLADGSRVFAKTLTQDVLDVFVAEADGLTVLAATGAVGTPDVLTVTPRLLVLSALAPRPDDSAQYWARLGRMIATLHTTERNDRFGWHSDNWLGRTRQINTWTADGYAFFAEHRLLRWLPEPSAERAFDTGDRRALENLCADLPSLVPDQPAVLTHGDLHSANVMADAAGAPAVFDPAVSYAWPEVDISMMWCIPRPPASASFFSAYREVAPLHEGWQDRAPLLHLRELLSMIAHGDDDGRGAARVRDIIAPYRRRS